MALLEVQGITKRFGGLVAVNDFSLSVDRGHIVALIGPNGAGKTTAFNVIAGFYKPNDGKVVFDGMDITGLRSDQICKLGLARTFQVVRPFGSISVLENVMVGAYARTNDTQSCARKSRRSAGILWDAQAGWKCSQWAANRKPQAPGNCPSAGNRTQR